MVTTPEKPVVVPEKPDPVIVSGAPSMDVLNPHEAEVALPTLLRLTLPNLIAMTAMALVAIAEEPLVPTRSAATTPIAVRTSASTPRRTASPGIRE